LETFEDAKIGDRVWNERHGWGTISSTTNRKAFPLAIDFDNSHFDSYTKGGRWDLDDLNPTLFWDEIHFDIPPKPKKMVKKTVDVWINPEVFTGISQGGGYFYLSVDDGKDYLKSATLTYEIEE
jgi:hypothetical protein